MFRDAVSYKAGSNNRDGSARDGAKAKLALSLEGIVAADLQKITDELYQEFVADLQSKGLEIIGIDQVGSTETYAEFTKRTGGQVIPTEIPGMITVTPTGHEYYVKGLNKKGREKKGFGLLGDAEINSNKSLSKELGNALVAKVNLYVMFKEMKEGWNPSGATVKIKTNLRLVAYDYKSAEKKERSQV